MLPTSSRRSGATAATNPKHLPGDGRAPGARARALPTCCVVAAAAAAFGLGTHHALLFLPVQPPGHSLRHRTGLACRALEATQQPAELPSDTIKLPDGWVSFGSCVKIQGATAAQAYAVYAHLPNHPQWSSLLTEVQLGDGKTSTWCLRALGMSFCWTAKTTTQVPAGLIAWESTSGLPNKGSAKFKDLPDRAGPACRVCLEMALKVPSPVRYLLQSRRLSQMASEAIAQDLQGFREVVLNCDASSECVIMQEDPRIVNSTHSDKFGLCNVVVWRSGRVDFELRGFGTTASTRPMLQDCSEAMAQLDTSVDCAAFIDMSRGVGCSPLAVPNIVNFLQRNGTKIKRTAVLGQRALIAFAQAVSLMVRQPDVAFFADREQAEQWVLSSGEP